MVLVNGIFSAITAVKCHLAVLVWSINVLYLAMLMCSLTMVSHFIILGQLVVHEGSVKDYVIYIYI